MSLDHVMFKHYITTVSRHVILTAKGLVHELYTNMSHYVTCHTVVLFLSVRLLPGISVCLSI